MALIVCALSVSAFAYDETYRCPDCGLGVVEHMYTRLFVDCPHEHIASTSCEYCTDCGTLLSGECAHDFTSSGVPSLHCSLCGLVCSHEVMNGFYVCHECGFDVNGLDPYRPFCWHGSITNDLYKTTCDFCGERDPVPYVPPVSEPGTFDFVEQSDFLPVLGEVLALIPTVLLAVVGFIGIRKGLGFLLGRIRGV